MVTRRLDAIRARLAQLRMVQDAGPLKRDQNLAAGPPVGSKIRLQAWRDWHRYGWVKCPRSGKTCSSTDCGMGVRCREMLAVGLDGDGSPLRRRERPTCGARNRAGDPCRVRVELGKRRCRFHGGLSTGPKTAAGRARIAEAQRRRWAEFRLKQTEAPPST